MALYIYNIYMKIPRYVFISDVQSMYIFISTAFKIVMGVEWKMSPSPFLNFFSPNSATTIRRFSADIGD